MKQIKNFQTITKEGFSVANLQRFPSREWGDEGGFQADVLFKSQKIAQVFQQGDGGCADVYFEKDLTKEFLAEVKDNLISFLKRYDYCYQESSPYEWLKKKTAQDVGNDEFETLVVNIEAAEDNFKLAQKRFKAGVNCIANIIHTDANGFTSNYLQQLFQVPNSDKKRSEHLEQVCEQLNIPKERTKIHYIVDSGVNII